MITPNKQNLYGVDTSLMSIPMTKVPPPTPAPMSVAPGYLSPSGAAYAAALGTQPKAPVVKAPVPNTTIVKAPVVNPPPVPPPATVQPLYDTTTGFVTPYGLTQGAKPVQAGDPASAPVPPPDSAAGMASVYSGLSPDEIAAKTAAADYLAGVTADANQVVDPKTEYQNTLARFQDQINATNKVYQDQLNAARIQGQGRIESRQFSQGRSGQIGSGTGEAGINAVQDANTQVIDSINNERDLALQGIYSKVSSEAVQSAKDKTAAKKAGAEALLKYYDELPAKKASKVSSVIKTLVAKKIVSLTPDEVTKLSNDLGVSKDEITGALADEVKTQEKATKDAAAKAAKDAADVAKTQAETTKATADAAKTTAETALVGKMTEKDKAQLAFDKQKLGSELALRKWQTIYNVENRQTTAPEVKQFINTQMATPEFKAMTDTEKADFILANGGSPSDFGL